MRILGNDRTESLFGTGSGDDINAGGGDDRIEAGGGNDTLNGGSGNDVLLGGAGNDIYIHVRGDGVDRIDERSSIGSDTIEFVSAFPIRQDFSRFGDDLFISDGSGGGLRLTGHFDPSNTTGRVETAILNDGRIVDLTAVIAGGNEADALAGTSASDEMHGGAGNDTLDGGGGSDYLAGGEGDDTYVWGSGYGNERVSEVLSSVGEDTIELRGDLTPDDVRLSRQDRDLVITLNSGETLRVENHFSFQSFSNVVAVETLKFSDGTTVDLSTAALDGRGSAGETRLTGQEAGEVIRGGSGSDTITGNGGADALLGGAGDDRYQWNAGDGFDVINEQGAGGVDTLSLISFGSLDPDDVGFSRTGNDLRVHVGDETITVRNQYTDGPGNRVEILEYGDGSSQNIDLANVKAGTSASDTLNGTFDAESLYGSSGNDIIDAGAGDDFVRGDSGNDTIFGGSGSNTLIGGTGNDEIHGGADRDAYFWKPGDGDDVIFETRGNDFDYIRLDSSIPFEDISYIRSGYDLTIKIATGGSLRIVGQYEDGDDNPLIETLVYGSTRSLSLENILNGGSGDETVSGGTGIDTFPATPGDDLLLGGAGDDVYYFGLGSGHDVVDDSGGFSNDVRIGPGIEIGDLDFTAIGNDLVISIAGNSSDSLTIKENYGDNISTAFEYYVGGQWVRAGRTYAVDRNDDDTIGGNSGDNVILPAQEANLLGGGGGDDLLYGGGGDDQLQGGDGDDTLVGGPGDDYLIGQAGVDVYRWSLGDGSDRIDLRFGSGSNEDSLEFGPGLDLGNVSLSMSGDDLVLTLPGEETIRIFDHFDPDKPKLREIRFDDGTVFPVERVVLVTSDDVSFEGGADPEYILAGSVDNTLSGGGGDDTINGGPGSDTLDGGAGTDVYQIGGFTGDDIIVTQGTSGGRDVIEVRPSNITVEDLSLQMNGDDLVITLPNGGTTTIQNFGPENRVGQINLSDGTRIALDGGIATGQFSGPTSNPDNTVNAVRSTFFGTDENDSSLSGSVYGEVLDGRDGDDTILAGGGDDTLIGGAGNDRLDGEGGNDRYVFSVGHGDDVIADREGDNTLVMADGVVAGQLSYTRLGQDLVISAADSDDSITLEGFFSEGGAQVKFIEFSNDERLELDTLTFEEDGTEAADTLSPVHPNMVVRGGGGDDVIQANFFSRIDSANLFDGGAGDDTLTGVNGRDHLIGGAGDDALNGGSEDDTLDGGAGDDTLTASSGDDLLIGGEGDDVYLYSAGSNTIIEEVNGGRDEIVFTNSFYTLDSLVFERIGDDLAIHGSTFFGFSSSSTPLLTIQDHFASGGGVRVEQIRFADDSTFSLSSVEPDWFGGTDLDDTVAGSSGDDTLFGQSGNDSLAAGTGDDRLIGGFGTDRLEGGLGSDTYQWDGGHGSDVILDSGGSADVIQLNDTSSGSVVFFRDDDDLIIENRGHSDGAHLRVEDHFAVGGAHQVEQLVYENGDTVDLTSLSIATSLTLTGSNGRDTLEGGAGDDLLRGGADSDTYLWGPNSGNDRIEETSASGFGDTIRLSSNLTRDDVSFGRTANDLTLTLVTGEVLTVVDHFAAGNASRIENLPFIGTAAVLIDVDGTEDADTLTGTTANETLRARGGADVLDGGDGADLLQGGAGDDVYRGAGIWQDTIDEQGRGGEDRIELAEGLSEEDVSFRRFGDDLRIDIGQETPITVLNHYEESGASRIESLRFADGSEISLLNPPLATSSFMESRGTDGVDRLVGGAGVDRLIGAGGDDTLIGNDGSDSLVGGDGNDVLIGGGGNDQYFVEGGNDTIDEQGGGGTDRLILSGEVRSSDLTLQRSGDDLTISVNDGRSITVLGHFDADGSSALEAVTFGSGTSTRSVSISDFPLSTANDRTADASSTSESFSSSPQAVTAESGDFDIYSGL